MSKNRQYLESHGWRLFSRRKFGMYIKERWYHPNDGSQTYSQGDAITIQRHWSKASKTVLTEPSQAAREINAEIITRTP